MSNIITDVRRALIARLETILPALSNDWYPAP